MFYQSQSAMPLSLQLSVACHSGWSRSCLCISQSHVSCCCCLDGHLVHYFPDTHCFCHIMLLSQCKSLLNLEWNHLPIFRLLSLTPHNVISLKCNNTDVVYDYALFIVYLQVCIKYIQGHEYYIIMTYIVTGAWHLHAILVILLVVKLIYICTLINQMIS